MDEDGDEGVADKKAPLTHCAADGTAAAEGGGSSVALCRVLRMKLSVVHAHDFSQRSERRRD